jgi:poly(3-hydroxybutyrate) depolymerase
MRAMSKGWRMGAALAALLGGAGLGAVRAEETRPAWASDLEALRAEVEPLKRVERALAFLSKEPEAKALLTELARPHPWNKDARTGMMQWTREVPQAGALTVFAYVPTTYTPEKAWPALLWLHGGVARDGDGGGLSALGDLREACEAQGILLVAPSATKDCVWWSPRGEAHARAALRDLATQYRVDPARTAVGGFSDGASAGYHVLAHDPDAYGCVVALMGNPLVSRGLGGPCFPGNCASLPVLAFNGGQDPLYPAEQMQPLIDELSQQGARITWVNLPEAGHDLEGVAPRLEEIWAFWQANPRVALPTRIDWECAVPAIDGRRAWVEILEVDPAAPGAADLASQALPMPAQAGARPRLGIGIDRSHTGPGLLIEKVEAGTPAAEAGFAAGDVLVKAGETDLPQGDGAFMALRAYLDSLGTTDGAFTVKRGEQTLTLTTRPRILKQDEPSPSLGYGLPSGRIVAEVKAPDRIEVRTRGVRRLRLHLARPLVDTSRPLTVMLNGKQAFQGQPAPEVGHLLGEALRALPGDPVFEAQITLQP